MKSPFLLVQFNLFTGFVLAIVFCCSALAVGSQSPEEEFAIKKRVQRERVIDFYQRILQEEKLEAERRRGVDEVRQARIQKEQEEKLARKRYISNQTRPAPADPSKWEAEVLERQKKYEKSRKDYVSRKLALEKLLKGLWKIPEEEEFDLYPQE